MTWLKKLCFHLRCPFWGDDHIHASAIFILLIAEKKSVCNIDVHVIIGWLRSYNTGDGNLFELFWRLIAFASTSILELRYKRRRNFVNIFYIDVLLWIMCMPLQILLFVNKWLLSYEMKKLYKDGRN